MLKPLFCWHCGAALENVIYPVSRRETCTSCNADQHVCKMCKEYDTKSGCVESRAEDVTDREKANFCDYFTPSGQHFEKAQNTRALDAKAKLAALFGDSVNDDSAEAGQNSEAPLTAAQIAERKLRDLLGD